MGALTGALYDHLAGDGTLTGLLATYRGGPAIFTTDPAPGDAEMPYLVTAGEVAAAPFDTKTTLGNVFWRDVRCYAEAGGSAAAVEGIADRVRELLHRQSLAIPGFVWIWAECTGPVAADEEGAYGRVVTVKMVVEEV